MTNSFDKWSSYCILAYLKCQQIFTKHNTMNANLFLKKPQIIFLIAVLISFSQAGCGTKKEKVVEEVNVQTNEDERPLHPDVKTDYGSLPGGYTTMDEYYIDKNGNKVWHGRRVNFYPSGAKEMEAFYEYGEDKGYIKYDEVGNVLVDTRK